MKMHRILLAITALTLVACRGDPSVRDTDPQTSRSLERPVRTTAATKPAERATETESTPAPQTANGGAYLAGDGPGSDTPENLHLVPDAVPQAEPLHRYANRPYTVLGKDYTPLTKTGVYRKQGVASWYGKKFHGQKTSIGDTYDMYGMTAAHTTLPIPSYARVTNLANQKSVIVRVNDRGPFMHERIIDLSYTAASKLGLIGNGQGQVEVESLSVDGNAAPPIAPIYKEPIEIVPLAPETHTASSGKIYLQLGAFNSQSGAEKFMGSMRQKLGDTGKQVSLFNKDGMVKVRIGPYASADAARSTALKLEGRLGFKPMVNLR